MHEGVIRDVERQQGKKIENFYWLQQQIEMNKILRQQQELDEKVALKLLEVSKETETEK